ncbi:MAG TPA: TA system VapC family ribonuclease toxin [Vicinamibacterales bacterium]|nr:TA system VapC family ribonuclease toxin [Vicinamibacterales bacterium]
MRTLFDVNLLVAMLDEDHVHHERAHAWWAVNRKGGWASCPLTQNGCVRVLSQPGYPNPLSVSFAHDFVAQQIAATDHAFWPDDISLLDETLFDRNRILGPGQLTDVYLLALAVRKGGRLATFDRAVPTQAVRAADARHLVVL